MRAALGLLVCGVAVGSVGLVVSRAAPPPPVHVPFAYVVPQPIHVAAAVVAPPARHLGCAATPASVGTKIVLLPTPVTSWRVTASAAACVIAVWSDAGVVYASWDDGMTFERMLDDPAPPAHERSMYVGRLNGVAIADDGTIAILRDTYRLGVMHPDGGSRWTTLSFRGGDETALHWTGRWLVMATPGPALSDDDGVSWRHLDWPGAYLDALRVLDDGTIVAKRDWAMDVCDCKGCGDGPTDEILETRFDGRPWRTASGSHAGALGHGRQEVFSLPGGFQELDSHGLPLTMHGADLIRYVAEGRPRVLFTGGAS